MFITFEGIDGAGKTTLSKHLFDWLMSNGHNAIWTKEPTLDFIPSDDPQENLNNLLIDRQNHLDNLIIPNLNNGVIVISDRYHDSTLAYQGYAQGLDVPDYPYFLEPDLTFLLDVRPDTAIERISKRPNKERYEDEKFLARVVNGYRTLYWLRWDNDGNYLLHHNPRIQMIQAEPAGRYFSLEYNKKIVENVVKNKLN